MPFWGPIKLSVMFLGVEYKVIYFNCDHVKNRFSSGLASEVQLNVNKQIRLSTCPTKCRISVIKTIRNKRSLLFQTHTVFGVYFHSVTQTVLSRWMNVNNMVKNRKNSPGSHSTPRCYFTVSTKILLQNNKITSTWFKVWVKRFLLL